MGNKMQHLRKFNENLEEQIIGKPHTKVLLVTGGDDFHALSFEKKYGGTPVKDIIDNLSNYESPDEEWELEVHSFGFIDPKFVKFVKSRIQDYDDSKNTNFYLDTDTI